MPVPTLNPSPPAPLSEGFPPPHSPDKRKSRSKDPDDVGAPFDPPPAAPETANDAPFSTIVRTDLSTLCAVDTWTTTTRAAPGGLAVDDVLGNLWHLLAAVQIRDAGGAREAANALQFDLFSGAAVLDPRPGGVADASIRLIDDLSDLIRSARLGDVDGAEQAARMLAGDLKHALIGAAPSPPARRRLRALAPHETASLVQGANAAYEKLMEAEASVGI